MLTGGAQVVVLTQEPLKGALALGYQCLGELVQLCDSRRLDGDVASTYMCA